MKVTERGKEGFSSCFENAVSQSGRCFLQFNSYGFLCLRRFTLTYTEKGGIQEKKQGKMLDDGRSGLGNNIGS
jgi:hypothetical protein